MRGARVVLGGTFDRLHAGHRRLLAVAFRLGQDVALGLTTDRYLRDHPKAHRKGVARYALRRRVLVRHLRAHFPRRRWSIHPLEDAWGRSVTGEFDVLVASEETESGTRSVNLERRRRGLPALRVRLVPLLRGEDGLPIHSSRIRAGAIDGEGRRRRPLDVRVRAPVRFVPHVKTAFAAVFPRAPMTVRATPRAGPGGEEYAVRIRPDDGRIEIEVRNGLGSVHRVHAPGGAGPSGVTRALVGLLRRRFPPSAYRPGSGASRKRSSVVPG